MPKIIRKKTVKAVGIEPTTYQAEMVVLVTPEPIGHPAAGCPDPHVPNATTRRSIAESAAGRGVARHRDARDMFKKLGI
jgi:hypothetical protein